MELKKARKVCVEMRKNLGGEYIDALDTLGAYLSYLSWITKKDAYKASGFAGPEFLKELHKAWPEKNGVPVPMDFDEFLAEVNEGRPKKRK